jgi:NADP-dependent 3-hydroxy acid dehydrogenase YdfG
VRLTASAQARPIQYVVAFYDQPGAGRSPVVALDITDDASVRAAAQQLADVKILVNNAGVALGARLIAAADLSAARQEMEVNYFGLLRMCRVFAPVLAANGGGTPINVLSILARVRICRRRSWQSAGG